MDESQNKKWQYESWSIKDKTQGKNFLINFLGLFHVKFLQKTMNFLKAQKSENFCQSFFNCNFWQRNLDFFICFVG